MKSQMMIVRKTGGAVPRIRLVRATSRPRKRLRAFASCILVLSLFIYAFYAINSTAQTTEIWSRQMTVGAEGGRGLYGFSGSNFNFTDPTKGYGSLGNFNAETSEAGGYGERNFYIGPKSFYIEYIRWTSYCLYFGLNRQLPDDNYGDGSATPIDAASTSNLILRIGGRDFHLGNARAGAPSFYEWPGPPNLPLSAGGSFTASLRTGEALNLDRIDTSMCRSNGNGGNPDNGTPRVVSLELVPDPISENGGFSTVRASVSPASATPFTVTISAQAVSPATSGDFTLSGNTTLNFAAGATQSSGTVTIAAMNNNMDAPNKSVRVSGSVSGGTNVTAPEDVFLTITDDDGSPTGLALSVSPDSVAENGGSRTLSVTATLTGGAARSVATEVTLSALDGTATSADFSAGTATLEIPANNLSGTGTLALTPTNDQVAEGPETLTIRGTATGLTPGEATITITDDDAATLSVGPATVNEGEAAHFTVTLSREAAADVQLNWTTEDGTATAGSDYRAASGPLTISAGQTSATISVTTLEDFVTEETEAFTVRITAPNLPPGVSLGTESATGTINDDEAAPVVSLILGPDSISENGGVSAVRASVSPASATPFTVTVSAQAVSPATSGDFTLSGNTTLNFAAGATQSTGTVMIRAENNNMDAPDKSVVVSGSVSGGTRVTVPADVTLAITDDEGSPTGLTLSVSPDSVAEGAGSTTLNVTATLTGGAARSVATEVTLSALDGTATSADFSAGTATLEIPANNLSGTGTLALTPTDDAIAESPETLTIRGTATGLSDGEASITITDNDTPPDAPLNLSARAGGSSRIDLSWTAPEDNGSPITGYKIEVSEDEGSNWADLEADTSSPAASYAHTGLAPNTTRHYRVSAINAAGPGQASNVANATTQSGNGEDDGDGGNNGGNIEGETPLTPITPPQLLDVTVDGNKVVLTYNEPLDEGSVPDPGDFMLSTGDVESVDVSGPRVTLTLESPINPGEGVTLSYTPGTNPIRNKNDVGAEPITSMTAQNIGKAPALVEAIVVGNRLTLTYDEMLDKTSVPTPAAFSVMVNGEDRAVTMVKIDGRKVKLTLESPVEPDEEVTLSYDSESVGSPSILDLTEIPAAPLNNLAVTNLTSTVQDNTLATTHWLSHFGRTVAIQAVEMVDSRLKSPSMRQESRVTLGGRNVDFFGNPATSSSAQDDSGLGDASRLASLAPGFGGLARWSGANGAGLAGDDSPVDYREISMNDLLLASSFHLASAQSAENGLGVRWTAWGRGARAGFHGDTGGITVSGDVTTGTLGADYEWDRTMVGVALSHSRGEGHYSLYGQRSAVEAKLTSAYPYIRYTVNERLSIWGMFGFGNGDFTLNKGEIDEEVETNISMRMGAFGFRSSLFPMARQVGYDLALKSDVMVVEMEADEVDNRLLPVDVKTSRFRLLLEGSREYKLRRGASLTPSLAIGLRYDGGDAEQGGGIELGGGFRFFDPSLDMVIDVSAHGLLLHEESSYRELGVGGSVQLMWGNRKPGLSIRVGSSWGDAPSGVERLWSQPGVAGLASDAKGNGAHFEAEVGYGMNALGGLLTPYAGLAVSEGGNGTYRVGGRLRVGERLSLRLEGDRRERVGGNSSHGVALVGSVRW